MPKKNPFRNIIDKIFQSGIRQEMSVHEGGQVIMVNKGSILYALNALLFAIYTYFLPAYELCVLDISCIILSLSCITINDLGKYKWAKIQLALTTTLSILIKSFMFGEVSNTHYLLFPAVAGSIMVFNIKYKRLSTALVALPIAAFVLLEYSQFGLLPALELKEQAITSLKLMNAFSSLLTTILITYFFLNTSSKQTKLLSKARKQLKAIFDNSFDAIFTVDGTDLTIVSCNHRSAALFDCESYVELHGRSILSVLATPLSNKENQDIHRQLIKYQQFSKEVECISIKGRRFWGNLAITTVMEDETPIYLVRITDVTLKKLQEEKISRNEAALFEAQKLARMGRFEFDIATSSTIVSEELKNLLGYPPEAMVDTQTYLAHIHPDDAEHVREQFVNSIQQGLIYDQEYAYIRPVDGETIHVRGYGKVFTDKEGNQNHFIGSVQDITAAKLKEKELIAARKAAEDASRVKEEFLSVMSHEIRTPLNAVIGMTHLLLQENPMPSQLESLKTLKFSADNLLCLVNDILDFNKIEAGKISLEEIPFNIRDLVNAIKYSQLYRVEEKHIDLEIIIDQAIPEQIVGDPVRISQILSNLLSNAVKFTNIGKVLLEINLLREEDSSMMLAFKVQDTGIGIPKDKHDYIFENFTQASASTTRKYGGTGLGLAITKRLLLLLNSQIKLQSEEAVGSTFTFELAFKKYKVDSAHTSTGQELSPFLDLQQLRLLLVEDNPFNQLVAKRFLNQWNIEPHTAFNGQDALQLLQENTYDLILMDLQMPEMDGYETTRRIRQSIDKRINQIPIIAFTATAMLDVKEKLLQAGMNDFITKPFNPQDLHAKIIKFLPAAMGMHTVIVPSIATEVAPALSYINFAKIIQMAAGSKEAEKEFIELYIESIQHLQEQFVASMSTSDAKLLHAAMHRAAVTLSMIEASPLLEELNAAKLLLAQPQPASQVIEQHIQKVYSQCQQIIQELQLQLSARHTGPIHQLS